MTSAKCRDLCDRIHERLYRVQMLCVLMGAVPRSTELHPSTDAAREEASRAAVELFDELSTMVTKLFEAMRDQAAK